MIDTLTKLCEKLADLIRHHQLERKKEFDVQVEPLFGYMREIHEDYTTSFSEICATLRDSSISDGDLVQLVESKKARLDHVRQLVHDLTITYLGFFYGRIRRERGNKKRTKKTKTLLAADFLDAVVKYLQHSCGEPGHDSGGGVTRYAGMLDWLEDMIEGRMTREETTEHAESTRKQLPNAWRSFSGSYVALRDALLK
ncbi:MAG: hypothetical protein ACYSUD_08370 [Planctomycetota bacterium]|jgi:hypothetical protein